MTRTCSTALLSRRLLSTTALLALVTALSAHAEAAEVFAKPPTPGGGVNSSSWVPEDGSDSDTYAWDEFTLAETQTITSVTWRGGYALGAPYGHATDFRISFFNSNASGFEPLITALPEHESQETVIATFHTNNSAGETFATVSGGVVQYDYHFTLPTPVTLQGGVKYWFRVVAGQPVYPDWGMATGTGGNANHIKFSTGTSMFLNWPHDLAFALHAKWANLGHGYAGTAGVPVLSGAGSLAGGAASSLSLSGARPSAPVWIAAGVNQLNAPFKGGVLVPDPLLLLVLNSDATGQLQLPFVMPVGLPGQVDILAQAWIVDPLANNGFAASNGVAGTTP